MRTPVLATALAMTLAVPAIASAQAATWTIDPGHSAAQFSVRHMVVANVKGEFDGPVGTVTFDPSDLKTLKVDVSIATKSVNTRNADRDKDLRSDLFFDVAKFPRMTFKSKRAEPAGPGKLKAGRRPDNQGRDQGSHARRGGSDAGNQGHLGRAPDRRDGHHDHRSARVRPHLQPRARRRRRRRRRHGQRHHRHRDDPRRKSDERSNQHEANSRSARSARGGRGAVPGRRPGFGQRRAVCAARRRRRRRRAGRRRRWRSPPTTAASITRTRA